MKLVPEPTNEHDPNAVMVFTDDDVHIGYVPREDAPFLATRDPMPEGRFVEFVKLERTVHLYFDLVAASDE